MKKIKNHSGSILIITIMILSLVLITTLSIVFVSNIGRNMSTSSNDSLVAYQRAETGIEKTLAVIVAEYDASPTNTLTASDWNIVGTCDPATGKITKADQYTIQLMKRESDTSTTMIQADCDDTSVLYAKITILNAIGTVPGKTQRAVSANVPRQAP